MTCGTAVSALALTLAIASPTRAQDVLGIASPQEAQQHLQHTEMPYYPRLAEAAGIGGDVVVLVTVGPDGHWARTQFVRSQSMLDETVAEAVRRWTFQPFVAGGQPVSEQVPIVFSFLSGHGPTATFAPDFASMAGPIAACEAAIVRHAFAIAKSACEVALQTGNTRGQERWPGWMEGRAAAGLGRALVGLGQIPDALGPFDHALQVMPKEVLSPAVEDRALLLADAARAYDAAGYHARAIDLYSEAAKLLGGLRDSFRRESWITMQRDLLTGEAAALDKAGRAKDAEDARKRAAKLK